MKLAEQIAEFDRINRTRSLTDAESLALEKLVKQEYNTAAKRGYRPSAAPKERVPPNVCRAGHSISGDNAMPDGPRMRCRICHNARMTAFYRRRRANAREFLGISA